MVALKKPNCINHQYNLSGKDFQEQMLIMLKKLKEKMEWTANKIQEVMRTEMIHCQTKKTELKNLTGKSHQQSSFG